MPFEVYLSHTIRCWKAQEEWARQLSSRKQVWLTASLGIVGIGLLRFVLDWTSGGGAGLSEGGPLTARLAVVGLGVGFLLVLGGIVILVGLVDPLLRLTLRTRRWLRGKLEWIRWSSGPSSALLPRGTREAKLHLGPNRRGSVHGAVPGRREPVRSR